MELSLSQVVIAILGSFFAGVINTLAGNGSTITLSLLTDMIGLPGNVANGTNRIGIFFQSFASLKGFSKFNLIQGEQTKLIAIITIIGAIIGTSVAVTISNENFLIVFRYMMVLMLIVVLFKPERWLNTSTANKNISKSKLIPVFLILGFYGGFIQMGMGIFFLAMLVLVGKYDLMSANAIKTLVVGLFTFFIIGIFAYKGLIRWDIGMIMAIGQSMGGYLTARYGTAYKYINNLAYGILVAVIVFSLLVQFNIIENKIF
ncbi:MAG: sulfite exporter TauE/SafE family protein [Saprospiraceae bacterium]